jgi:hypothetical protein
VLSRLDIDQPAPSRGVSSILHEWQHGRRQRLPNMVFLRCPRVTNLAHVSQHQPALDGGSCRSPRTKGFDGNKKPKLNNRVSWRCLGTLSLLFRSSDHHQGTLLHALANNQKSSAHGPPRTPSPPSISTCRVWHLSSLHSSIRYRTCRPSRLKPSLAIGRRYIAISTPGPGTSIRRSLIS